MTPRPIRCLTKHARAASVVLAAALLLAGCQMLRPAEPRDQAARPNVLFIAVDDLNDWVGYLGGHPQAETPNLDRLARRGVFFTHAYTAAPACNPSRVALMTGLRPTTTGIYHNPQPWRTVLPDVVTLPQYFRRHGYTALGSGKIYHDRYPDPASWDAFAPSLDRQRFPQPMPPRTNLNGLDKAHFDWGPIPVPDAEMSDARTVDWVIAQLEKPHDEPFFLACGIYRPHLPWYVPPAYFDRYPTSQVVLPEVPEDDLDDIPAAGRDMVRFSDHKAVTEHGEWAKAVQGYLASITFADRMVGRVLDALDRSDHADNTIVVLWSDHGWHLGEKQHWRKFALWEEATRVPLILSVPEGTAGLPGGTPAGVRSTRPVNLVDLYPTLVELAGLPDKTDLDGTSLVPLLRDPAATWAQPALTTHGRGNHAVRSERWRYIRYADGAEELYDHQADPRAYTNLASDPAYRSIIAVLRRWLPASEAPSAPREARN